jgi:hypothetical protein
MAHKFAEIAFTPTIREIQRAEGSRASYAPMDEGEDYNHELRDREASSTASTWPASAKPAGPTCSTAAAPPAL